MGGENEKSNRTAGVLQIALIVAALAGVTAAVVWPRWRSKVRAENERHAATMTKILSSAEADFRANDRDGNGVNDFWTGDVAGLYKYGLIPREVAEADLRPLVPLVPKPIPYKGYYYIAMQRDESEKPIEDLRQATDKTSGKVHHLSLFGFSAYPADYGVTGRETFIVNQNNTVRWRHTYGQVMDYWPNSAKLRNDWALGD